MQTVQHYEIQIDMYDYPQHLFSFGSQYTNLSLPKIHELKNRFFIYSKTNRSWRTPELKIQVFAYIIFFLETFHADHFTILPQLFTPRFCTVHHHEQLRIFLG
jgi:hypothetical protein